MESRDFVYWLPGYFELTEGNQLTENQVQAIKDHLSLVMDKQTPSYELPETVVTKKSPTDATPYIQPTQIC